MNTAGYRYLIIGGAPRSGTTSLYRYLADHPGTCASTLKETRFFMDADYPLQATVRFDGHNLEEYGRYFAHGGTPAEAVRVEASPDYLYSRTALMIADVLPQASLVFVRRDPVERMVSWFIFAKQRGLLAKATTFEEYVLAQAERPVQRSTPTHLRALDQCRFEAHLAPFRQAFGPRCRVIPFERLVTDAQSIMTDLAEFVGLDPTFYASYAFRVENASGGVRSGGLSRVYHMVRRSLAAQLRDSPRTARVLRWGHRALRPLLTVNDGPPEQPSVSDDLRRLIRSAAEAEARATAASGDRT